jgi:hypothetical protein
MHKNATKCNKTQSKWCINKHGASKIIDTFTYQIAEAEGTPVQKKLEFGEEKVPGKYLPRLSTPPPPPPSTREQKRPKKQVTPKKDKQIPGSAGSGAEHHRDQ